MNKTKWIDASKELPPEGVYVLVHHTRGTWKDSKDQLGVEIQVAKLIRGISLKEREKMKSGLLHDPDDTYIGFKGECKTCKRSQMFHSEDESGNNKLPYIWQPFGPNSFYGQEIDYWMPIDRNFK